MTQRLKWLPLIFITAVLVYTAMQSMEAGRPINLWSPRFFRPPAPQNHDPFTPPEITPLKPQPPAFPWESQGK